MFIFHANLTNQNTGKNMTIQKETEKFDFLKKRALELGAADAQVIRADQVVVEDRVVLKCKVGCNNYGKTLACPPYTPSAEEFRKIVSEYSYALFMKFTSKAEADPELQKTLSKSDTSTIEKEAMRQGYSLALSFVSGTCQLCEKCSTETRICVHPEMARYSEDAVGVNVKKTAKNAGITFVFPFSKNPESFALLLID